MTTTLTRADIAAWCSNAPPGIREKLIRFVEGLFTDVQASATAVDGAVAATGSIQNATVLTLSSNAAFDNERVLTAGDGITITDNGAGATLVISAESAIKTVGGYSLTLNLPSDSILNLPALGRIPSSNDGPYADDTAAAAAGVNVGEWYAKTGGTVAWRVA